MREELIKELTQIASELGESEEKDADIEFRMAEITEELKGL